ncbi:MAG: glutathione S-transferase C-terminal domain-containing protein [Sporolactobacillus sp.]
MSNLQEDELKRELTKINVSEEINACPIDFSMSRAANPRAHQKQKDYAGLDPSNFNDRARFSADQAPQFTKKFGDGADQLPIEADRYRLIWSKHCPWATRIAVVIDLLGLDRVISKGVVDPLRPAGVVGDWFFTLDDGDVDPVLKTHSLGENYRKADSDYSSRVTVPALVDIKTGKVVNNDFHHLTLDLEVSWGKFKKAGAPDLYPKDLRSDIDALNQIILMDVNNAVNTAGLARSQEDYERTYDQIFNRLDWLEERLGKHRFLFGNHLTDTDIRLYVTLVRFDLVFYQKYYVNKKRLIDYPNLWNYTKDLYSFPSFKKNTDFDSMKKRFFQIDHTPLSDLPRIIPKGPDLTIWDEPNDRDRFGKIGSN